MAEPASYLRRVKRLSFAAGLLAISAIVGGCGSSARSVDNPFVANNGEESGPGSGAWGDTISGPKGMHIGCIPGRKLAVLVTVHNRTKRTIILLGGGGPELLPRVMERVAIQVRLAPPPPKGDAAVLGLRSWNPRPSSSVAIPPGRGGWVQSNFLMRNCALLRLIEPVTVNRSITLTYSADGTQGTQVIAVRGARIILTRGPRHPTVPINQVG
jgi:hypothetical protein